MTKFECFEVAVRALGYEVTRCRIDNSYFVMFAPVMPVEIMHKLWPGAVPWTDARIFKNGTYGVMYGVWHGFDVLRTRALPDPRNTKEPESAWCIYEKK